MVLVCLCLALLATAISGLPYSYSGDFRWRRSPQRAVMVSGYYGRPALRPSYDPDGSMTAFISGDTLATNSFMGTYNPAQESEDLEPANAPPKEIEKPPADGSDGAPDDVPKPTRVPKHKPQNDEEDDEDEGSWPFQLGRKGPSYTAFFPIMLGGNQGRGRSNEGYPGSATAIANSFSTGRGGVASSHATAYGDPYASTLFRNFKKKPQATQVRDY